MRQQEIERVIYYQVNLQEDKEFKEVYSRLKNIYNGEFKGMVIMTKNLTGIETL